MVHLIFLCIPISLLIGVFLFYESFSVNNFIYTFFNQMGGYFVTIPFFYFYYFHYFRKNNKNGIIFIQLEILVHFIYTFILLFYSFSIKNYNIVYNFLIFLAIYNIFKLAILFSQKKSYL